MRRRTLFLIHKLLQVLRGQKYLTSYRGDNINSDVIMGKPRDSGRDLQTNQEQSYGRIEKAGNMLWS